MNKLIITTLTVGTLIVMYFNTTNSANVDAYGSYRTVTYQGCEYVESTSTGDITHKGNCVYCVNRK